MEDKGGIAANEPQTDNDPIARERLYELVWSEPMLRVAGRFNVSSSYLARICAQLNVPRPERGYWAKLAVGKTPPKPPLPDPLPGDEVVWSPHGAPVRRSPQSPRPPSDLPKRTRRSAQQRPSVHPLIAGAKALFEAGRTAHGSEYLRPFKRLLVDVVTTKSGLDKALDFANELFLALEAKGHRVLIAPKSEKFSREEVDEREVKPKNDQRERYHLWRPDRVTVVYIGTVAVGLTVIEISENVEVRYVNGKYVRESEYVPPKGRFNVPDYTWKTHKDFATGRICLQAYSPYHYAKWIRQWGETPNQRLADHSTIIKALENSVSEIARLYKEGERKAELEHQRWEAQMAEWRRQEEQRRIAKALQDSKDELVKIIESWATSKRLAAFFADAERRLDNLEGNDRQRLIERLSRARQLIGSTNALERFDEWKTPEER